MIPVPVGSESDFNRYLGLPLRQCCGSVYLIFGSGSSPCNIGMDMDPDPGLFMTHTKMSTFFKSFRLFHFSFDYEGIPLKKMENLKKLQANWTRIRI